jgi:hypothetical protein
LIARQISQNAPFRLMVVDPATGDPPAGSAPIDLEVDGAIGTHAFSEDGSRFAFVSGGTSYCTPFAGGSACWGGSDELHLIDLQDQATETLDLPTPGRVSSMVFDPAGEGLALVFHDRQGSRLLLVDAVRGAIRTEAPLPFDPSVCGFTCTSLAYTRDAQGLLVFGADPGEEPGVAPPGPAQVALLEADRLEMVWQSELGDLRMGSWCLDGCDAGHEFYVGAHWYPAVVWDPSADRLLAFHAEADRLSTVDMAARVVRSVDLHESQTWLDRLVAWGALAAEAKGASQGSERRAVASADGSRVYTLGTTHHAAQDDDGDWQMWTEALGLDVIDPDRGERLAHVDTEADDLAITGDGRWLLLVDWGQGEPRSEILDATTLETQAAFEGWSLRTGRSLEGDTVILAYLEMESGTTLSLVDDETLDRRPQWAARGVIFLR